MSLLLECTFVSHKCHVHYVGYTHNNAIDNVSLMALSLALKHFNSLFSMSSWNFDFFFAIMRLVSYTWLIDYTNIWLPFLVAFAIGLCVEKQVCFTFTLTLE